MLDCLVSYFGLDEDERAGARRYFCYHIVAGPGPTTGAGVASISTLALHDETKRCTYCQNFHTVEAGGPAAAMAAAVHYLDAYHEQDHVRKVQSDIRGLQGDLSTDTVQSPGTRFRVSGGQGVSIRKG
jgi:pyruvate-formate lyase-activating enzyme